MKCRSCGLIYANPQPIPFDIQDHYGIPPDSYWRSEEFDISDSYFLKEIKEAKKLINFKHGMKALDVGAGLGKCMLAMDKEGFDAYGLEPSLPFYERMISKMGIDSSKVKLVTVEDAVYTDSSFDFITYGAVFEHLYNPAQNLEKTLKWLKPGGVIHLEVPSSNWLLAKFINAYYKVTGKHYVTNLSPMHVPFHLYEFSLKSFELAGKRFGFSIIDSRFEICALYGIPKFFQPMFRKYMELTKTGMQLTVYLKKIK
jgi:2-polyprenyl-3-methyl-5-hydroxy-6-metoxy-1,4-benzoquinol methylase